jgi:hypothetical protein
LGSHIDVNDGGWRAGHTGIGAGVDRFVIPQSRVQHGTVIVVAFCSYLEYLLKAGIVLDDDMLMAAHEEASKAVSTHLVFRNLHVEVRWCELTCVYGYYM